jgi:DNA-binding transcriptional LysR family regulator
MNETAAMATFVAVARAGSFAAAARQLGLSTTAASRHVAELERRLGVTLLRRSTRSVTPTEAGARYLPRAAALLDELARLNDETAEGDRAPSGLLRVTAPPGLGTVLVVPLALDFAEAFPEVALDLDLSERTVDLVAEGYDAAIRSGPLRDSSLIAHRLATMRYRLVAAPAYLAARGTPAAPPDLARHPCLQWRADAGRSAASWTLVRDGRPATVEVRRRLMLSDLAGLRAAAIRGLGIALLPELAVTDDLHAGRLTLVLPDCEAYTDTLSLVRPPGPFVPARLRAFIDFATRAVRARTSLAATGESA